MNGALAPGPLEGSTNAVAVVGALVGFMGEGG